MRTNDVYCAKCKQQITETGTSWNGYPVHIKCYHELGADGTNFQLIIGDTVDYFDGLQEAAKLLVETQNDPCRYGERGYTCFETTLPDTGTMCPRCLAKWRITRICEILGVRSDSISESLRKALAEIHKLSKPNERAEARFRGWR